MRRWLIRICCSHRRLTRYAAHASVEPIPRPATHLSRNAIRHSARVMQHNLQANTGCVRLQDSDSLTSVQRTPHSSPAPIQSMRVDHRRLHALVAHQLLNGPDVVPVLQQVRRESCAGTCAASRASPDPAARPPPAPPAAPPTRAGGGASPTRSAGPRHRLEAGKTYCQPESVAADGYFRARAVGRETRPNPAARSRSWTAAPGPG